MPLDGFGNEVKAHGGWGIGQERNFPIIDSIGVRGARDVARAELGHNDLARYKEDKPDIINSPKHYTSHPSGVECIEIVRHMPYNIGVAMAYLWRTELKNGVEDLKKAVWHIQDEISMREKAK